MLHRKKVLPEVPIYFLVGVIPENFGGMLTVALQRSSVFAELDRRNITLLTRSPNMPAPSEVEKTLRDSDRLSEHVSIRNTWSDLDEVSDAELREISASAPPVVDVSDRLSPPNGAPVIERRDDQGRLLQSDHFRTDGTRSISDMAEVEISGGRRGRLITAYARDGQPVGQWRNLRTLLHDWVAWVIGADEAILIIDAAPTGGMFFNFQRDNITKVQVLHNHHLRQIHTEERVEVGAEVMRMFTHLDWFDGVAVLTDAQRQDLVRAGVVTDNSFVAPNMLRSPVRPAVKSSGRAGGVIVARLVAQKRLDHALDALARVRDEGGAEVPVRVYGTGPAEAGLISRAEMLGLENSVRWKGYEPDAKRRFGEASFTVMSSLYEGHPVALLEAMSAGCIPIVYDIEYGPSEIITDGVDGFLVAAGDVNALADAVLAVENLSEPEKKRMRRAAVRRARSYSPSRIANIWGENLQALRETKTPIEDVDIQATLMDAQSSPAGLWIVTEIQGASKFHGGQAMAGWIGRKRDAFGRVRAELESGEDCLFVSATIPWDRLSEVPNKAVLDLYIDLRNAGCRARTRIEASSHEIPEGEAGVAPYVTAGKNLSLRIAK